MAVPDPLSLLPPVATARIAAMGFRAHRRMSGPISGHHSSPLKGASVEFAEHRPYVAGDDLRDLDWRVLAKSDRYSIKQYIAETNLRAHLLVDASASMRYTGDASADGRSKFDYARHLALGLGYLLIEQQDAVGLARFDEAVDLYVPARSGRTQLHRMAESLLPEPEHEPVAESEEAGLATCLHELAERLAQRSLVILVSDLLGDAEAIAEAFVHLGYRRHEVIVFHVLAEEERSFPFRRFQAFRDLEGQLDDLDVDPGAIRAEYLDKLAAHVATLEQACGQIRADFIPCTTSEAYDAQLCQWLGRR